MPHVITNQSICGSSSDADFNLSLIRLRQSSAEISEEKLEEKLYTANQPDVDLLIRTSGEQRLSNFMLWQVSYAEMVFVKKAWPDFKPKDLHECIRIFQNRGRRFGGI